MFASRLLTYLGIAGLGCGAALATALPDDRHQAIEIESREAIREEAKGLTIYSGDVTITQGSIRIDADRVTVHSEGSDITRIVCIGRPARYQQRPEPASGLVIASGNTIQYNLDSDVILLTGNASLEQDEATLSGERIEYDLKQEVIRASGGDESGRDRIRMVIPPSQQPEVE